MPLIVRALAAAGAVADSPPTVVLGAHALRLRALLARRACKARIAHNAHWRDGGLSSSLRAGLRSVPRTAAGLLVVVVDQPAVGVPELTRLARAWRSRPRMPAAAHYDGRAGVPAILPRSTWPTLRAASGDAGARAVLRAAASVTLVPMPQAALDLDTPDDLAAWSGLPAAGARSATSGARARCGAPRAPMCRSRGGERRAAATADHATTRPRTYG